MTDDTKAIRDLFDAQAERLAAGDAAAMTAAYTDDAAIYSLAPPLQNDNDTEGLQAWIDGWDRPSRTTYRDVEITVAGDMAVAWGFARTETVRDGEKAASGPARNTWAFRREADGWKIAHEHSSVPFYMDGSFRAAIDLEPGSGKAVIS